MPAPSRLAKRLADDLVEVGKMFGFEATLEQPIQEGSLYRVDVFWKLKMPESSPFSDMNIASIEIQYSDSPSSISHGIFKAEKTLHPAVHFVISYFKLSNDYKENVLKAHYPHSGLRVIDGETKVRNLNLWITKFITNKGEEKRLAETGRRIRELATSQTPDTNQSEIQEKIREKFQSEIEEIVTPHEITSLIGAFAELESTRHDRRVLDKAFNAFIKFVQRKLAKYKIPSVDFPASILFNSLFTTDVSKPTENGIKFENNMTIRRHDVIIKDCNSVVYNVSSRMGNAYIESIYEVQVITRWEEPIDAGILISFFKKASVHIEKQVRNWRISDEEKKLLETVIETLHQG